MAYIFAAAARGEEYEVSFAKVLASHRSTLCVLDAGTRRNVVAELLVDIAGIAGAVESSRTLGAVHEGVPIYFFASASRSSMSDEVCDEIALAASRALTSLATILVSVLTSIRLSWASLWAF